MEGERGIDVAGTSPDLYDYGHRVDGFVQFLGQAALPFVAAVEGEWGRGKSTFVKMIVDHVQGWTIAHFHPWRYDIREWDEAWQALVEVLQKSLEGPKGVKLSDALIQSRRSTLMWRMGMGLARMVPGVGEGAEKVMTDLHEFVKGPRFLIFDRIRDAIAELTSERPLLLVIDDLDRCLPIAVCHVLRCIPTLFAPAGTGPRVAILLALDRSATENALMAGQGLTREQAEAFLEKLIHVHVTLPILQLGRGDAAEAAENIRRAIAEGGHRSPRIEPFPTNPPCEASFEIRRDQIDVIARFMRYNPRKIDRFCLLFDLKWKSRFHANREVFLRRKGGDASTAQAWLDSFRDRLIWETIVELRWPTYDAKLGDLRANQEKIRNAISGSVNAAGLPCDPYIGDPAFLEIHRLYDEWSRVRPG